MESEADRLASIRALGGRLCVRTQQGTAPAIFDNGYVSMTSETGLEQADRSPEVTLTTRDAERIGITQGVVLDVIEEGRAPVTYTVRIPQPDGAGMTVVPLDATT